MKISPVTFNFNYQYKKQNPPAKFPVIQDTVSFTSMKRNKFKGSDLLAVNRFLAPIEKFNSNDDFQKWCADKRKKEYDLPSFYLASNESDSLARLDILDDWKKHLDKEENSYTEAQKLLISQGVVKGIKGTNSILPPALNREVLKTTMDEIEDEARSTKKPDIDFNSKYINNLKKLYLDELPEDENGEKSGWLVIKSAPIGTKEYEEAALKLHLFSTKMWCTKSNKTSSYIGRGDFHIYIDKGKSVMAVRYEGDTIVELQNDKNDSDLPEKYIPIMVEHIKDEKANFDAGIMRGFYKQKLADMESGK